MNSMVKQAGESTKATLKDAFGSIGSIISGGAILAGMKGLLNHFDELDDRARNLSISTDFLQGMEHIASNDAVGGVKTFNKAITELSVKLGDAKTGSDDAIKKFEKWGITLKDIADLDTEGMFYKIADRIKAIPDPSERSAAAFELLGKAGKSLVGVMQEGSAAVKGMVDQVDKLDSEKLKMLADAKGNIQDVGNTATIWAGKALGAIGKAAQFLGNPDEKWMTDLRAKWDAQDHAKPATGPDKSVLAAQADKLLEAANKYRDTMAREAGGQTQLNSLIRARHDLQAKINAMQGDSVEKYALMTEQAKNEKDIREQQAKMDKEAAEKRKAETDKRMERLKEEKDITKQIRDDRTHLADLKESESNMNAQYGTLQEVANSGGPLAWQAQQAMSLDARAHQERIWGNKEGALADESQSAKLKQGLEASGAIEPTMTEHLKSIREDTKKTQADIGALLAKATTDGIKVIGPDEE